MKQDLVLNNMEEVYFDKEGRDKLINGINKLNKAVSSTLGPNGKTVIIPDKEKYGEYKVTKDGVSVANSIWFTDPVENIGANLLKQAAQKQVEEAYDGTTTTTILTTAFINNLKDFNPKDVNKAFDEIIPKVINELRKNSRQLKHEDIKYVATISANNDVQIGELIQQAYSFSDVIKIEESNGEDKLECIDGMSLPVSYFSKKFITNDKKGECELENPFVIIVDGKLEKLDAFKQIIPIIAEQDKSLLIITEHVNQVVLDNFEKNVLKGALKACIIKAPGFSKHRKDLLNDIAKFTGATVLTDLTKVYSTSILGKLKSATISKNNSILTKDDNINIEETINSLKEYYATLNDKYEKELLEQRISNLSGKVSIIKVGGNSELEMKERKDRYEDAVGAVKVALEEGIVEGGGVALFKIWNQSHEILKMIYNTENLRFDGIERSMMRIFTKPFGVIFENNGIFIDNNNESKQLINRYKNINMFEQNIIDPLKVTRCALENAVSVAKTILSTEAIVLSQMEWNK